MFGGDKWIKKCLGEVGTFKRGGGFQKSDYVEHGIPCIHYGQIHTKFGPFISSHITEISLDLEVKTKFASKGDLIIAITSEDAEGSCKSTAWLGDYPVAVGGHAAIFNHSMNPLYMTYFFKSAMFNHAKMEYVHGTKVVEMRPDDIAKISIPYPPMSLQEQFSAIAQQADKSGFDGRKSQFIEMFAFQDLSLRNPSDDFGKKCYDDTSSATKVPAGDYQNKGRYAIFDQSQDCYIAGYTDSIEGVCNNYPAVLFGDHSRVIKYINQPFYIGADGVKIIRPKEDDLLPEFLYYDLLYHNIPNTGYNRHFKYVKMFKLTEASIDEQKEFLRIAHQADKSGSVLLKLSSPLTK